MSHTIPFYKFQGTGNDFIIIDCLNQAPPSLSSEEIKSLCDRRFGIGADGLMFLMPHQYDFYMQYYNSDGRESTMCGNGGRCISQLFFALHPDKSKATFMAVDGIHHVKKIENNWIALEMIPVQDIHTVTNRHFTLYTGSPHYVTIQENSADLLNIVSFGKNIRFSPTFEKEGINVNMIVRNGDHLHVATYERGVEDETYSCGTGVVASAIIAHKELRMPTPISILTKGGNLQVDFTITAAGSYEKVILKGPAIQTFTGTIDLDQLHILHNKS